MSKNVEDRAIPWVAPAICAISGLAYLVAAWASGRPILGLTMLLIMLAFGGGLILAGRRSETVRGLLDRRDERITAIDVKASAAAGLVVIIGVLSGVVVELARGNSGAPYTWLAALGGVAYLTGVLFGRLRG